MKCGSILAVPMMIEIFQERVKMVSAANCKQNRSVTVVGTLYGQLVTRLGPFLVHLPCDRWGNRVSKRVVLEGW